MEMEVDRISNLPWNIVDNILCRLTLRDAVTTSILSHDWRYKWANLTSLVFDDDPVQASSQNQTDEMVKIVDRVLLLHNGPIHKFNLCLGGVSDIDRWILFLSRTSVREIILEIYPCDRYYKLPSSLYLCDKLSHLQLSNCLLKPPSTFNGFKNLTSLNFFYISVDQDVLENLISCCPLLERLTLAEFDLSSCFKIHAPKLTFFKFFGALEDVSFENTVHLSTVHIGLPAVVVNDEELSTGKLIKFFASLPSIQRLMVQGHFLGVLAAAMVPRRLRTPCMQLNYLSLHINFIDMDECEAALCILRSSPNLLKLVIDVVDPDDHPTPRTVSKKLCEEDYEDCFLDRLRFVNISNIFGDPIELDFIKFLLLKSPGLERMTVKPLSEDTGAEVLKELVRFRRASAHAEIVYVDH